MSQNFANPLFMYIYRDVRKKQTLNLISKLRFWLFCFLSFWCFQKS